MYVIEKKREELQEKYGQVFDTRQLQHHFSVMGFCAPFVEVVHKETNKRGTLEFTHNPRFYFNFVEAKA